MVIVYGGGGGGGILAFWGVKCGKEEVLGSPAQFPRKEA